MTDKYIKVTHCLAVTRASKAGGKGPAILLYAILMSDHKRPEVTFTLDQVCDDVGMSRRAFKRGLRALKDEGTLEPIKFVTGGSGNAVRYRLCIAGEGRRLAEMGETRYESARQRRDRYWRAKSRKFGPVKASEMADEKFGPLSDMPDDDEDEKTP